MVGYRTVDTTFKLKQSSKMIFKLPLNIQTIQYVSTINKKGALKDLKKKDIRLYVPGGWAKIIFPTDEAFEKKYHPNLIGLGCMDSGEDNYAEYNQTVFTYLDKKYGKQWRTEIRQDVIGLK